jgi:hypothetical protein
MNEDIGGINIPEQPDDGANLLHWLVHAHPLRPFFALDFCRLAGLDGAFDPLSSLCAAVGISGLIAGVLAALGADAVFPATLLGVVAI